MSVRPSMKATIESTELLLILGGLNLRVWTGTTEDGVPFVALINRIEAYDEKQQPAIVKALQTLKPIGTPERAALLRLGVINENPVAVSRPPSSTPSTKS